MGRTPNGVQHLLARYDLAGVAGEQGKDLEFLRRELDLLLVAGDAPTRNVDLEATDPHNGRLAGPLHAVAQRCPQARHKFADAEWLVDKVVGAAVERQIFSVSRSRAESTTIGTSDQPRTRPITSLPSMSGRPRSSTTTSGTSEAMRFSASAPLSARSTS